MTLFSVHAPTGNPDDAKWMAVWAPSAAEAEAYYRENLDHGWRDWDEEANRWLPYDGKVVVDGHPDLCWSPESDGIHLEHRPEVLREAGFRLDGERACDCCGLAAMGLEGHRVCGECERCPDCGAEEGCLSCGKEADQ